MAADLSERIREELDRREQVAREADGVAQSPWGYLRPAMDVIDREMEPVAGPVGEDAVGLHMAFHDPADALRRYAAARRVLERHHPASSLADGQIRCWWCAPRDSAWPCDDIRDLAASLGIEVSP